MAAFGCADEHIELILISERLVMAGSSQSPSLGYNFSY